MVHKLTKFSRIALGCSLLTLAAVSTVQASDMGMVTGSSTGTYLQFGKQIAEVAKKVGVGIEVKTSQGSLANIRRLTSNENAAMGIVQSDVLGYLARSKDPEMKKVATELRLIFPFYNEEVHILAKRSIKTLADLDGKVVALGSKGSGSWLTAVNLFGMTGVVPKETLHLDPKQAVRDVIIGAVDAMVFVGGKPVKVFTDVEQLRNNPVYSDMLPNVHFVEIKNEKVLREYTQATIGAEDYSWINSSVNTVAVKAALISYDFSNPANSYHKNRCKQLKKIGNAMRTNLPNLIASGHPKWAEVDLDGELGIWPLDRCSRSANAAPAKTDAISSELACIISGNC